MLRRAGFMPSQLRAAWEEVEMAIYADDNDSADGVSLVEHRDRLFALLFGAGPVADEFRIGVTALPYRTPHPIHLPVAGSVYVNTLTNHFYTPADPSYYEYRPVDNDWSALDDPELAFTDRFFFTLPANAVRNARHRQRQRSLTFDIDDDGEGDEDDEVLEWRRATLSLPVAGTSVALVRSRTDEDVCDGVDDEEPSQHSVLYLEISRVLERRQASGLVEFDDVYVPTYRALPECNAREVFSRCFTEAVLYCHQFEAAAAEEQH